MISLLLKLTLLNHLYSYHIIGTLEVTPECVSKDMSLLTVFNTKNKSVYLYQAFIPDSGSFELNVNEGEYGIEVVGKNSCSAHQRVTVSQKTQNLNVTMVMKK